MPSIIDNQIAATGIAQVIVVLKSPPPPSAKAATGAAAGAMALTAAATTTPGLAGLDSYFVQSESSQNFALAVAGMSTVAALTAAPAASTRKVKTPPAVLHFPNLGVLLGTVTREGLGGLRADERVQAVIGASQPSLIRPVTKAAAKLSTQLTWGIQFLEVPKLWNQGLTGKGVRVGHLDTGADGKH